MYICNRDHEEIVHEYSYCPLCETLDDFRVSNGRINDLEKQVEKLEAEISSLEGQVEELKLDDQPKG